jgi:hypothetical protein
MPPAHPIYSAHVEKCHTCPNIETGRTEDSLRATATYGDYNLEELGQNTSNNKLKKSTTFRIG